MKPDQTPGANQDAGGIPVYPDAAAVPCSGECSDLESDHYHRAAALDAGLRERIVALMNKTIAESSWSVSLDDIRTALAAHPASAGPAVDVDRLNDFDLAMLKASIVQEAQRRYRLTHPDPTGDAE